MKLHSDYLNIDVEASSFQDGAEEVFILTHSVLERCIYNAPVCQENGVTVEYTALCMEPGHYAMLCRISDKNGRSVECVGEAMPTTLKTQIAQDYPVLMAVKRAFDDAALKFLRFPKAYSDQQIQSQKPAPQTPPTKTESTPVAENKQGTVAENAPISENDSRFSQPLTFGKKRGKSLNELWPDEADSIKWLADLNAARDETKMWKQAAIDFLKLKEA